MDCVEEAKAASKKDDCPTLQRIAKAPVQSADDPLFKALLGCGLALDFPRVDVQLDEGFSYPCFPPKSLLETVANEGFFHKVLGVPVAYSDDVLPKFWTTYKKIFPDHEIFQHPVDYSHLLPFYLHGDGGRTYKKDSIMVLSMFSAFGEGTSRNPVELQPVPGSQPKKRSAAHDCGSFQPGVNLKGNPYTNRFLFTAMKTEFYKKNRHRFTALLDEWGKHLGDLFNSGFTWNGDTWRIAILGMTGDAPFLREAGHHTRSFSNVRKSSSSTAILPGVCYLCAAGRTNGPPFEDVRISSAEWTATRGPMNALPWNQPSPLLQYLVVNDMDLAGFFKPDLFHIFHAGVGKDFTASCIIYFCKTIYRSRKMDDSLANLNVDFRKFIQEKKEKVHFRMFSFQLLGYVGSRSYPKGHWSKNLDTAVVGKFIEHCCAEHAFEYMQDPCIPLIIEASGAIHQFMHIVFTASFFLTEEEAWQMIAAGHAFLLNYAKLAQEAYNMKLCLFAMKPVVHMLAHIVHTALQQFRLCSTAVINPISESTFMSEDFIGRVARISRRVSAKKHGPKIMFRYMVSVKHFLHNRAGLRV